MELTELQAMWQQYDVRLAENTRINKEILKRMLRSKPERRLKWMKGWAIYGMAIPIPVVCIALIQNIKFRNEWDFYLGLILLIAMLAYALYRATRHFLLIRDIDFTNQVAKTKKQLIQLEGFRLKETKQGGLLVFFFVGLTGICLLCQLPVMTPKFILFTIFLILTMIVTNNIHLKRFKNQMNSFNAELDEIEQLEKE
jgi:FtsH-binding integral membrane protein